MCDVQVAKIVIPDEVVVEALLKDARRFKSKWELHSGEPTRSKPNVIFLKRTLNNVVKTNKDRMRKPQKVKHCKDDGDKKRNELDESPSSKKSSRSRRDTSPRRRSKKSGCSKSKYRSPESRGRSSKKTPKSSKTRRESSSSGHSPKR